VGKKFITILRNCLSFYKLYAEHDDGRVPNEAHVLDAWIIARLNETLEAQTKGLEAYELADAARVLQSFVTDLSTWYVRRSRDRMKTPGEDRAEALATLRLVMKIFSKMLAPFMPFLAEVVYQELKQKAWDDKGESIHLSSWPTAAKVDTKALTQMGEVRAIVSRIMEVRDQAGKAVKQALGHVTITTPTGKLSKNYLEVILDEVNVKKARVKQGDELAVELDLTLTPELVREGMARELTRRVNGLRKEAGLTIADRIELKVWSASEEVKTMLAEYAAAIAADTLSTKVDFAQGLTIDHQAEFRVAEQDIWIGF